MEQCPHHVRRNHACPICARISEDLTGPIELEATLPEWLGKECVPETREATFQLLDAWTQLIGGGLDPADAGPGMTDDEWYRWTCKQANVLQVLTEEALGDWSDGVTGVWVGFPETMIGWLNARLAGQVHRVYRWRLSNFAR